MHIVCGIKAGHLRIAVVVAANVSPGYDRVETAVVVAVAENGAPVRSLVADYAAMVLTIGDFAVSGIDEGYEATRTRGRSGYEVPIVDAAFQGAAAAGDAAYVPYSSSARRGEAVGIATVVDTVLDERALIGGSYYA